MISAGKLLHDRYEIVRLIAQGGMGAVYEGRDRRLGNSPIAIKHLLLPSEHVRHSFEREALLLARLSHPGLPKVRDYFTEGDGYYFVMEHVAGSDLGEVLASRQTSEQVMVVLGWAQQLLNILEYLHPQQPPVIHRDIKPANIKLTPQGHIVLLDFGLAKGADGGSSLLGYTANFAPPEQLAGERTDARSDLYALGATLFNLLTGQQPASALTRLSAKSAGKADPQRRADEINPQVPVAVGCLLAAALELDVEVRIASAGEMKKRLQEAMESLPASTSAEHDNASGYSATVVSARPGHKAPSYSATYTKGAAAVQSQSAAALATEATTDLTAQPAALEPLVQALPVAMPPRNTAQTVSRQPFFFRQKYVLALCAVGLVASVLALMPWIKPRDGTGSLLSCALLFQKFQQGSYLPATVYSGVESVGDGDKLQLKITSHLQGYLYVFGESMEKDGTKTFSILFPTPKANAGSAIVSANQQVETGWNLISGGPGTEFLWLVHTRDVAEAVENARKAAFSNGGTVTEAGAAQSLQEFLHAHANGNRMSFDGGSGSYEANSAPSPFVSALKVERR